MKSPALKSKEIYFCEVKLRVVLYTARIRSSDNIRPLYISLTATSSPVYKNTKQTEVEDRRTDYLLAIIIVKGNVKNGYFLVIKVSKNHSCLILSLFRLNSDLACYHQVLAIECQECIDMVNTHQQNVSLLAINTYFT